MKFQAWFMYLICVTVLPVTASPQQRSCSQPCVVEFDPPLASPADGGITSFDAPNVLTGSPFHGTAAFSLNDFGATTGRFPDQQSIRHSFVRTPDGHIPTFDAPGADITDPFQGTTAFSINLQGAIAGVYVDVGGNQHGFVRSPHGTFTAFDPAGSYFTSV